MENNINKRYKSFTSLEQSKKLAEFLPIESADMYYHPYPNDEDWYDIPNFGEADLKFNQLPCWSLAALLDILDDIVVDDEVNDIETDYYYDPVDASVEMIIKLKEKELI